MKNYTKGIALTFATSAVRYIVVGRCRLFPSHPSDAPEIHKGKMHNPMDKLPTTREPYLHAIAT